MDRAKRIIKIIGNCWPAGYDENGYVESVYLGKDQIADIVTESLAINAQVKRLETEISDLKKKIKSSAQDKPHNSGFIS